MTDAPALIPLPLITALHKSKAFPVSSCSSPNFMLLSSARPRRKLVKRFIESTWTIMSGGRVWRAGANGQMGPPYHHVSLRLCRAEMPGRTQTPCLDVATSCSECGWAAHSPAQASLLIPLPPAAREQVAWKKIIMKRSLRNVKEQDEAPGSWDAADR